MENAFFIQQREPGYARPHGGRDPAGDSARYTDGARCRRKKDNLVNIGGWLAVNDEELSEELRNLVVVYEGLHTYGGMAGRDMEAMAIGIEECVQDDHIRCARGAGALPGRAADRLGHSDRAADRRARGVPRCAAFYPHIPQDEFPAQTLAAELYLDSGIRAMERGIVSAGRDPATGDHHTRSWS